MQATDSRTVLAEVQHLPGIAQALERAFHDDPLVLWVMDRARQRPAAARRFFALWAGALLPQGHTWTTPQVGGAAVWALPGQWHLSAGRQARIVASTAPATRRPLRAATGITRIERAHPAEPHLYLALLGVDPAQQGQGLGAALLAPGLERADEERWPCYLETAKPRNVDFYARSGFRVTGEISLPQGPTVWQMWREPA